MGILEGKSLLGNIMFRQNEEVGMATEEEERKRGRTVHW